MRPPNPWYWVFIIEAIIIIVLFIVCEIHHIKRHKKLEKEIKFLKNRLLRYLEKLD